MAEIGMTRDFFLWSIAAIYLFAFSSLLVQIPGNVRRAKYVILQLAARIFARKRLLP